MRRLLTILFILLVATATRAEAAKTRSRPTKKRPAEAAAPAKTPLRGTITKNGTGGTSHRSIGVSVTLKTTGVRADNSPRMGHSYSHVCVATTQVPNVMLAHWEAWEPDGGVDENGTQTYVLRAYERVNVNCGDGAYEVTLCINNCPPGTPPPPQPPDPYQLTLLLADSLPFHIPQPTFSPDLDRPDTKVLVGMPFFWSVPEVQFEELRLTATGCNGAACTSVWAQATPSYLYFAPGDGNATVTTCRRPGDIVRSKAQADASSDDCMYTYDIAGRHRATVGIHYLITGGPVGGAPYTLDPQDSEVDVDIPVWQFQPVIVG